MMTRQAKIDGIKEAISNVERFRRWFKKLPEKQIKLNLYFKPPKRLLSMFETTTMFDKKELKHIKECGSVGCVAGWIKYSPVAEAFAKKHGLKYVDTHYFVGGNLVPFDTNPMFTSRQRRKISQREEAIQRLDTRLVQLRDALKVA